MMITTNNYPMLNVFVVQLTGQVKAREILRDLTAVLNSGEYPKGANVIIDLRHLVHSVPCANFETLVMLVASNAHIQNVKHAILVDGELNESFDALQAAHSSPPPTTAPISTRHFFKVDDIAQWLDVAPDPLLTAIDQLDSPKETRC